MSRTYLEVVHRLSRPKIAELAMLDRQRAVEGIVVNKNLSIAAAIAAGLTAVTGCSSGGGTSTSSTSLVTQGSASTSSSNSSTTAKTGSSTPTASATTTGIQIPDAAKEHTDAGAVAFARYFISIVNQTFRDPKPGVIDTLAQPTCKSCTALAAQAREMVGQKSHYTRDTLLVKSATLAEKQGKSVVVMGVDQQALDRIGPSGEVISRQIAKLNRAIFVRVSWVQNRWTVEEVQV